MSVYNFPVNWHRQAIRDAEHRLDNAQRFLSALKVTGTPYHRAHVVVVELHQAALDAMRKVPAPVPMEQPHGVSP